jgi:hypothetical protein
MADLYDQASDREEHDRNLAIARARLPVSEMPPPSDTCLNCADSVPDAEAAGEAIAHRWCCVECFDDWSARRARKGS